MLYEYIRVLDSRQYKIALVMYMGKKKMFLKGELSVLMGRPENQGRLGKQRKDLEMIPDKGIVLSSLQGHHCQWTHTRTILEMCNSAHKYPPTLNFAIVPQESWASWWHPIGSPYAMCSSYRVQGLRGEKHPHFSLTVNSHLFQNYFPGRRCRRCSKQQKSTPTRSFQTWMDCFWRM